MHAVMGTGRLIAARYRLQGPLGRGAMGIVWRGRDELLHRDVAVKEVQISALAPASEAEAIYQRTLREARTAARLSHPGVVTIFDVVEEDGSPWIVMELIAGRSLDQVIAEDGPLPPPHAASLGTSLLGALATAHAAGVLHRDVKPGNVLVTADGRAVLTDFGIATFAEDPSLTQVGMVVGTPGFTAPERVRGESATPASDLWSLGATLYAAVEGRGPFDRAGGATAITTGVAMEDAPRAPSAGPLGPVIDALLRRDPAARPDAAAAGTLLAKAGAGTDQQGAAGHRAGAAGLGVLGAGAAAAAVAGLAAAEAAGPGADRAGLPDGARADGAGAGGAGPGDAWSVPGPAGAAGSAPAGSVAGWTGAPGSRPADVVAGSGLAGPAGRGTAGSPDAATAALPAAGSVAGHGGPGSFLDPPVYAELRMPGPAGRDPAAAGAWRSGKPGGPGGSGGPAGRAGPGMVADGLPSSLDPVRPWAGPAQAPGSGQPAAGRRQPWSRHWRVATVATGIAAIVVAAVLGSEIYSRSLSGGSASGQAGPAAGAHGAAAAGGMAGPSAGASTAPGRAGSAGGSTAPVSAAAGPDTASSPAGSGAAGPGTAPPAGYQWRTVTAAQAGATAGFVMAVPDGWHQRLSGQAAYFKAPGTAAYIEVSMRPFAYRQPGREAHALQAQALAARQYPGYVRNGIRAAKFEGAPAATWRFSWKPAGAARTAVLTLLATLPTPAGPQAYALTVSSPAASFAAAKAAFGQALVTFQPRPPS
jgi:eukaryotic-like serine/threonine-protein kinase